MSALVPPPDSNGNVFFRDDEPQKPSWPPVTTVSAANSSPMTPVDGNAAAAAFREGTLAMERSADKQLAVARLKAAMFNKLDERPPFDERDPQDFLREPCPARFAYDAVPAPVATFAYAHAQAMGFDQSGFMVAATVAAAAMIDDRLVLAVRPRSNWYERACLWAMLIGSPAKGKSPMINAASEHIKLMHKADYTSWWKENADRKREERDPQPALYTSDTTVEALQDVLMGNPRGMFMLTEEGASWIGSIDGNDRATAVRAEWLQLYDGGSHQVNRVGRGSLLIPNWSASVLAGCTPDGLRKMLKNTPEDGLTARILPVILGAPNLDAHGDCREALTHWNNWLRWIKHSAIAGTIELSPEAAALFDAENREQRVLADAADFSVAFASHIGKHGGMTARIALTFHVLTGEGFHVRPVSPLTMWQAIQFMRHVRQHAAALYGDILATSPQFDLARALARSVLADEDQPRYIGRNYMRDKCKAFQSQTDERIKRDAVDVLVAADWLEPGSKTYGGWPTQFEVHPSIYHTYSAEGSKWRARREAVRNAIAPRAAPDSPETDA
jgi:Protein of unknown function (DUF3987)